MHNFTIVSYDKNTDDTSFQHVIGKIFRREDGSYVLYYYDKKEKVWNEIDMDDDSKYSIIPS